MLRFIIFRKDIIMKTEKGANIITNEIVFVKNGVGFVNHSPTSYNGSKNIFGWIITGKEKQLFKKVKFDDKMFKFRKNWKKFNEELELTYWYFDENAKTVVIAADECLADYILQEN